MDKKKRDFLCSCYSKKDIRKLVGERKDAKHLKIILAHRTFTQDGHEYRHILPDWICTKCHVPVWDILSYLQQYWDKKYGGENG